MKEYFIKKKFRNTDWRKNDFASKVQINDLIRLKDDEISKSIYSRVQFNDEESNIIGTNSLIEVFNEVDNEKFDITTKISNVKLKDFDDESGQVVLTINATEDSPSYVVEATGIYDFTSVFLDSLFKLNVFSKFCLTNELKGLAVHCLDSCLEKFPNVSKQFRFIKIENELFLRGLTSLSYKNYDNHIALFLAICKINEFSKTSKIKFYVKSGDISDSNLVVYLSQVGDFVVSENCSVKIGVRIVNNEVREGVFSIQFVYTVSDKQNNKFTAIGEDVTRVTHNNTVQRIEQEMNNLDKLQNITNLTLKTIEELDVSYKLDSERLYAIFDRIIKEAKNSLSSATKERILIEQNRITNSVFSIIELFGKIETLTTDIDELLYLQKIFNDVLKNHIKK